MLKNFASLLLIVAFQQLSAQAQSTAPDPKMNSFVSSLMSKMTLDEKIGQLNLVTPGGGVATGSVVSGGVEDNIRKGWVGGLFGTSGPDKLRKVQEMAVK